MPNPLFNQLNPIPSNPMLKQLLQFKKSFSGDPQQMIQGMLNSGRISQAQLNQCAPLRHLCWIRKLQPP